ncbi:MAG: prolyl oligopeptidase family serine peptidase [Opitutae bacterium]|nr:prolyl oligopeptidase family serine peptidase [Opitutae bacterium]
MRHKLTALIGGCLALACAAATPPPAEPIPLATLFAPAQYRLPRLAPDGHSYSLVIAHGAEEALSTIDLKAGKATPVFRTAGHIQNYWWKNQDLLLILLEANDRYSFETFNLKTRETSKTNSLNVSALLNPLPDDPENVLFGRFTKQDFDPIRYNLRTSRAMTIPVSSGFVQRWFTDAQGKLVAGYGRLHEKWFMVLAQGDGWRRVELGEKSTPDFRPVMVAEDQRRLIGFDFASGDTVSVVAWDPANDRKELLIGADIIDPTFLSAWGDDWTRMQCVAYETDRPRFRYFNPEDQATADTIDAALPNTINYIASTSRDKSQLVISSTSDRVPAAYYLFDVQAQKLAKLGFASSKLPPTQLAASNYFEFAARDGLKLRGRVTLPPATSAPSPAVLLANLNERTRFGFSPQIQALATRGYAVVEIDTRGIEGYGEKFWAAGHREIGGKMVNDLLDGIDWLAAKGVVDPQRVAISAYGFNGLVALQAATKHPDRFAAWVNFWLPSKLTYIDYMAFVCGRLSKDEVASRYGGEVAMRRYIDTLEPLESLPKLRVPSFHFYGAERDSKLSTEAIEVKRVVQKTGAPSVFLEGKHQASFTAFWENRSPDSSTEWQRIFSELLPFLDRRVARK